MINMGRMEKVSLVTSDTTKKMHQECDTTYMERLMSAEAARGSPEQEDVSRFRFFKEFFVSLPLSPLETPTIGAGRCECESYSSDPIYRPRFGKERGGTSRDTSNAVDHERLIHDSPLQPRDQVVAPSIHSTRHFPRNSPLPYVRCGSRSEMTLERSSPSQCSSRTVQPVPQTAVSRMRGSLIFSLPFISSKSSSALSQMRDTTTCVRSMTMRE
jgi:hypothetical protein